MIKIENTDVFGWETAIRGMRNPMNSWDKSDNSWVLPINPETDDEGYFYRLGDNDFALMMKLAKAGSDHGKFMRMINVTCDIVAPLYWWKEFDTYKVGTVANSCSTMHKIHAKEFTLDDFSHEHLNESSKAILEDFVIATLNGNREMYLSANDKHFWWQMIQLLPSSYNQRRTVQLNYQVLKNMYQARKNHKLDEWQDFCTWIKEELPYSKLITEA